MSHAEEAQPKMLRFSLRTLVVITTIAAMVTCLFSLNRKNQELAVINEALRQENLRLRDELGELSVDDETQLHAIRTSSGESLEWAWRLWIPEGHEYKLRGDGGSIPEEGWPNEGGTIYLRDSGEHVVRYRIVRDPRDDKWYGSLSTRGGSVGKDHQSWVEWQSTSARTSGVGETTQTFERDINQPIELCRHRVSQERSSSKIEDKAEGFLIWLERIK